MSDNIKKEGDKAILNAIHERDIDDLLKKMKIKDDFDNGKIKCKFCGIIVNKNNIYSLFPESGDVKLVCDKPECINQMLIYIEEKKKNKVND